MKILIITRHFPPDSGALSYRMIHLAGILAKKYDLTVISSQPNRYNSKIKYNTTETKDGYTIKRIWSGVIFKGHGKLQRGLTEMLGALWMTLFCLFKFNRYDAVFVSSPPLLFTIPGVFLEILFGKKLIVDVRDLWVDWIEETKIIKYKYIIKILKKYEKFLFTKAFYISTATNSFRKIIINRHKYDPSKISLVYNGIDEIFSDFSSNERTCSIGISKIKIVYAGNLGPSQNLLSIIDGMSATVKEFPNVEFLLVGDGGQYNSLAGYNDESIKVLKRVDRFELRKIYSEANALLVHLAKLEVYKHTVPSKIFEYLYLRRPIICGLVGEAKDICEQYGDCYNFLPEDSVSLFNAIKRFVTGQHADNFENLRENAKWLLRSSRKIDWENIFEQVADKNH